MSKKGQAMGVNVLASVAIGIVVVALVSVIAIQILTDQQAEFVNGDTACGTNSSGGTSGTILYTGCGTNYNATADALEGVAKIPSKLPLIVTAVVGALLIGIVVTYFMRNQ